MMKKFTIRTWVAKSLENFFFGYTMKILKLTSTVLKRHAKRGEEKKCIKCTEDNRGSLCTGDFGHR